MMPSITCPFERVFSAGTAFFFLIAASEYLMILFLSSGLKLSIASDVQPCMSEGRLKMSGSVKVRLRRLSPGGYS